MKVVSNPEFPAPSLGPGMLFTVTAWAALIPVSWLAAPAFGAPGGELDATFGDNGQVHIEAGRSGVAVVQQPADGKLLVAGDHASVGGTGDFAVLRLNPNGTLDESFGTSGVAAVDFYGSAAQAMAMALQPDGSIVVAGMTYGVPPNYTGSDLALARLDADGRLDSTFGGDGRVILQGPAGRDVGVGAIEIAGNGSLLVVGTASKDHDDLVWSNQDYDDLVFLRIDSNGALDSTFGTGVVPGMTVVDLGMWASPAAAIRQPDGRFVACGTRYNGWDSPSQMFAVRVNADGTIDTGFGANGLWHLPSEDPYGSSSAGACLVMPDETFVLAGRVESYSSGAVVVRLRADGTLDTAAWNYGLSRMEAGGIETVEAIVALENGHFGIAGAANRRAAFGPAGVRGPYSQPSFPVSDVYVARFDPGAGQLAPDFGNTGVALVDFGRGDLALHTRVGGLIRQTDGQLITVASLWLQDALDPEWTADDYERLTAAVLARVDPAGDGNAGFIGFSMPYMDVTENDGTVVLPVRRTGGSSGSVLVDYSTFGATAVAPSDFTASSGTLSWSSGDMDPKLITIPITRDAIVESEEHFRIVLSNATTALAGSVATVWIEDEKAPLSVETPPLAPVGPGPAPAAANGGGAFGVELFLLLLVAMRALTRPIGSPAITAREQLFEPRVEME